MSVRCVNSSAANNFSYQTNKIQLKLKSWNGINAGICRTVNIMNEFHPPLLLFIYCCAISFLLWFFLLHPVKKANELIQVQYSVIFISSLFSMLCGIRHSGNLNVLHRMYGAFKIDKINGRYQIMYSFRYYRQHNGVNLHAIFWLWNVA